MPKFTNVKTDILSGNTSPKCGTKIPGTTNNNNTKKLATVVGNNIPLLIAVSVA